MAGLRQGGNEQPGSLKASLLDKKRFNLAVTMKCRRGTTEQKAP